MKGAALLRPTDYAEPKRRMTTAQRIKHNAWNTAYRRRHLDPPSDNLLPFRVPCPTPLGSKVYIEPVGMIARSLLGAVIR